MVTAEYSMADLLRVMQRLRDPKSGCPWDLEQDFHSIVPSTLEECYELAQAIEHEDFDHVAEELGDVLFQVIFYSQMGQEKNLFSFDEVVSTLVDKLIRRHPHVFANGTIEGLIEGRSTVESVKSSWEKIKQEERTSRNQTSVMSDIPLALPALCRAQKVQKRAAHANFDWPAVADVWEKLQEELEELHDAISAQAPAAINDEMGDVLFTCVNLARHLGLDAEATLRHATSKFEQRFQQMEAMTDAAGTTLSSLSQAELDQLWRQTKAEIARRQRGL
ncbi:MAG: nucleoside triphosphate pyrophosphohydrolase [Halioglobus sp.]